MDSMEKFENKELPKIEDFYSTLNEEHISEKDYNHAKEVWNAFRIKKHGRVSWLVSTERRTAVNRCI